MHDVDDIAVDPATASGGNNLLTCASLEAFRASRAGVSVSDADGLE